VAARRSPHWLALLAIGIACLATAACGGAGPAASTTPATPPPTTTPATGADIRVLMMGNSHTVVNDLPQRLQAMLQAAQPGKTVAVVVAPDSMFLDEHLSNTRTTQLLEGQTWSAVILQAQKYSSSGLNSYSTSEAETLVRMARTAKALPMLFPEWPRRGVAETDRIYNLHVSIAQKEAACVAPIGQAWDLALQRHPTLELYATDGNHSAPAGAHLSALVLFASLTGASPNSLPTVAPSDIPVATQTQLKQVAADAVQSLAPRTYCPADKPL
jgi:hypothetical protein